MDVQKVGGLARFVLGTVLFFGLPVGGFFAGRQVNNQQYQQEIAGIKGRGYYWQRRKQLEDINTRRENITDWMMVGGGFLAGGMCFYALNFRGERRWSDGGGVGS